MQLQEDGKTKYEELEINGASVVFSTVRLLDNPITEDGISSFCNDNRYREIKEADYGYIERMFSADNHSDNMLFRINAIDPIPNVWANDDGTEFLDIELNHYVLIYAKRAILLQTILIFDVQNKIKDTENIKTPITNPLSVTNLLAVIHDIKNSETTAGVEFYKIIKDKLDRICDSLDIEGGDSLRETQPQEQNIAIQIWDIASLPTDLGQDKISGDYLEGRYELDLAALLLLYDWHHTKDGLWKQLSSSRIREAVANRTDVLNDHRILASEMICIEISQVDKPYFTAISKCRLSLYGYDSTSTFLWGYLSIIEIGIKNCVSVLKKLCTCVLYDAHMDILDLSKKSYQVLLLKDQYLSIGEMCIEGRHKEFISRGITKKHLNEVKESINRADQQFQDLSNLSISETTSKSSIEISELFKAFRGYTEEQDRQNDKISKLGLALAGISLIAVIEYIESWFSVVNYWVKGIICGVLVVPGAVVACCFLKNKNKGSSSKKTEKKRGKRNRRMDSDN